MVVASDTAHPDTEKDLDMDKMKGIQDFTIYNHGRRGSLPGDAEGDGSGWGGGVSEAIGYNDDEIDCRGWGSGVFPGDGEYYGDGDGGGRGRGTGKLYSTDGDEVAEIQEVETAMLQSGYDFLGLKKLGIGNG